jgi:hypothetical protein
MLKQLSRFAIFALVTFAAAPAGAAPAFVYGFFVSSVDCGIEDCTFAGPSMRNYLQSMSVTLSDEAARRGEASLHVLNRHFEPSELSNNGFLALDTGWFDGPINVFENVDRLYQRVDFTVSVGLYLRGSFHLGNTWGDLWMASQGESLLWTGRIQSDWLSWSSRPESYATFAGEWRLTQVVPEPTGLALVTGLGLMLAMRRRARRMRELPRD